MAEPRYILMNGEPVPHEKAMIHVLSPAITYATTVFEGIRAYWNAGHGQLYLFRADDHLRRLQFSMRVMRYDASYTIEELREQLLKIIRANELREDIHLRMMAMVQGPPAITTSGPVGLTVSAGPYPPNRWVDKGMAVGVSTWQRVHDTASPPRVKATANYSNGRLAMLQAQGDGYDCALMLTREGKVAEAPVATCFVVRNGQVSTPLGTDGILESITRDTVIRLFEQRMNLRVNERQIDRTELYDADEMFFCGSGWEITPVASVDRIALRSGAPGPVTREIRQAYLDTVRGNTSGNIPGNSGWLTPVW